jgi:hypothetical protein
MYRPLLAALKARLQPIDPVSPTKAPTDLVPLAPEQAIVVDPYIATARRSGPSIRLGTDSLGLTLGGLLQVRGVRGSGLSEQGLRLQAARLSVDATAAAGLDLGLFVQIDLADLADLADLEDGQNPLKDAHLSFSPVSPQLLYVGHFLVGRMKAPVSRFRLRERAELPLAERPRTARLWAPDRRVGFAYHLDLARHGVPVSLWAGAYDGFVETNGRGPLLVARLGLCPTDLTGGPLRFELGGAWMLDRGFGPDDGSAPYDRRGGLVDARLSVGPVWAEAELFWLDGEGPNDFERFGWSVTAGAFALPDFLLLVLRYEELEGPTGAEDEGLRELTGGANLLYLGDRFQMMYNVIWTRSIGQPESLQHIIRFQIRI